MLYGELGNERGNRVERMSKIETETLISTFDMKKPILIVAIDSLRADHAGCYAQPGRLCCIVDSLVLL